MTTQYFLDDNSSQDGCIDVYRIHADESDVARTGAAEQQQICLHDDRRVATCTLGEGTNMVVYWSGSASSKDVEQVKRKFWRCMQRSLRYPV